MAMSAFTPRATGCISHGTFAARHAAARCVLLTRKNAVVSSARNLGARAWTVAQVVRARSPSSLTASSPAIVASAGDPLDNDAAVLQPATGTIKNVSFLSFWIQLALSLSSAAVLVFSVGITQTGTGTLINVMSLAGVALAFLSTFFAFSLQRTAAKLAAGLQVKLTSVLFNLNTTNTINLMGIATAVIGLQAAVGTLVGKSLTQPQIALASSSNLVSLDVFSLQALTNTLMAHFIALIFGSILMRALTRTRSTA